MDGESWPALLPEPACDIITTPLGLAEDQQPAAVHLALQQAAQLNVLLIL